MPVLVRAASLTHYVEVARRCGLDPWPLLREAGLPASCMGNPDLRISVEAVRWLLETSAERAREPAFALLMAEGRRVSNLGVLGMLIREEPTVRHAMRSLVSHGRSHNQALIHRIEESQGIATLHEELLLHSAGPSRQGTELVVAVAIRTMRFFLGADWRPRRVCFRHGAPASLDVHRRVLGQSPEFGADFNGLVCTSADLDTPIATADPVVAGIVRQQLRERPDTALSLSEEVRQMALVLMPRGLCTVDQVARLMGVNRRTLHRRLAAEGTDFSAVVGAMRRELALRYVGEPSRPLGEVAQWLGFADLSSFSRWHRQAFGHSAQQSRHARSAALSRAG